MLQTVDRSSNSTTTKPAPHIPSKDADFVMFRQKVVGFIPDSVFNSSAVMLERLGIKTRRIELIGIDPDEKWYRVAGVSKIPNAVPRIAKSIPEIDLVTENKQQIDWPGILKTELAYVREVVEQRKKTTSAEVHATAT